MPILAIVALVLAISYPREVFSPCVGTCENFYVQPGWMRQAVEFRKSVTVGTKTYSCVFRYTSPLAADELVEQWSIEIQQIGDGILCQVGNGKITDAQW